MSVSFRKRVAPVSPMRADKVYANSLVRDARLALVSPSGSGRPLSRQELADAVNAWVFKHLREKVYCTKLAIGVLERGQTRWPRESVRKGLCAVLGKNEIELGLYRNRDLATRPLESAQVEACSAEPVTGFGLQEAAGDVAGHHGDLMAVTGDHVIEAFRQVGVLLRDRRLAAGLSQQQLGELVGFSRSTVANVEIGRQSVTRDFWKLADQVLRAGGSVLAAFDQAGELGRRLRHEEEKRRQLHRPQPDYGLVPDGMAAASVPQQPAVMASGGFTLMVSATPLGGVRVVIETEPAGLLDSGSGSGAGDARVLSIDQARRERARRLP
jgi:transcriptional regulator with XRE-family HTH domain